MVLAFSSRRPVVVSHAVWSLGAFQPIFARDSDIEGRSGNALDRNWSSGLACDPEKPGWLTMFRDISFSNASINLFRAMFRNNDIRLPRT